MFSSTVAAVQCNGLLSRPLPKGDNKALWASNVRTTRRRVGILCQRVQPPLPKYALLKDTHDVFKLVSQESHVSVLSITHITRADFGFLLVDHLSRFGSPRSGTGKAWGRNEVYPPKTTPFFAEEQISTAHSLNLFNVFM